MNNNYNHKMIIVVPKELFENFRNKAELEYKTVSEVIRDLMVKYTKTQIKEENK